MLPHACHACVSWLLLVVSEDLRGGGGGVGAGRTPTYGVSYGLGFPVAGQLASKE